MQAFHNKHAPEARMSISAGALCPHTQNPGWRPREGCGRVRWRRSPEVRLEKSRTGPVAGRERNNL